MNLTARCSDLDAIMKCSASKFMDQSMKATSVAAYKENKTTMDPCEVGDAVHELAAKIIKGIDYDLHAYCNCNHITDPEDIENIAILLQRADVSWRKIGKHFVKPATEHSLPPMSIDSHNGQHCCELSGTVDCLSPHPDGAVFLDWKSGFIDDGFKNQRLGYAALIWNALGQPEECKIYSVNEYLRKGYRNIAIYTPDIIKTWLAKLSNALDYPEVTTPNDLCIYCKRYYICDARKQVTIGTIDGLINRNDKTNEFVKLIDEAVAIMSSMDNLDPNSPELGEAVSQLTFRCGLAEKACEDVRSLIKEIVLKAGSIRLPDERVLTTERVERKEIDLIKAYPVLSKMLSTKQILESCRMAFGKLINAAYNNSGGKKKKEVEMSIRSLLEKHGAIRVNEYNQIKIKEIDDDTETEHKKHEPAHTDGSEQSGSSDV